MYFSMTKNDKYFTAMMVFLLAYYMIPGVHANETQRAGIYEDKMATVYTPTDTNNPIYTYNQTGRGVSINETNGLFHLENDNKISMVTTEKTIDILKKEWNSDVLKKYASNAVKNVASGVKLVKIRENVGNRYVSVNVIEVNRNVNPNLVVIPATATSNITGRRGVKQIVASNKAILGINGTFFKPQNGIPLGALKVNGDILTGPINNRVGLGIGYNGFHMSKIAFSGYVQSLFGEKIKIDNINQPRMLASYTLIYSDKWGKKAPPSPKYGLQVQIKDNVVTQKSTSSLEIPQNGYVLVGPQKQLDKLKINEHVQVKMNLNPEWNDAKNIVSGGPYLVKNNQVYVDDKEQNLKSISGLNPRTAIGYTANNVLIIVTVDGRHENSSGVTIWELAKIMKRHGCVDAMNLDGGGSSQLVVNGKFENKPSEGGARSVSNAIIIKEVR